MARRKRKNPEDNHPALGAFLGSLIMGVPGHLMQALGARSLGAVVTVGGWIAGGAMGGYYGASKSRQRRSAIGGAIGGAFTPIGAAVGGYLGGRKPDSRKKNPSTAATIGLALGTAVVAAGAGYGLHKLTKGGTQLPGRKKSLTPSEALESVVSNSTLEAASFMVDDIQEPISLRLSGSNTANLPFASEQFAVVQQLRVKVDRPAGVSTIEEPASATFGLFDEQELADNELLLSDDAGGTARYPLKAKAISSLITGLSPDSAQLAYELALIQIADKEVVWSDLKQREDAIKEILSAVAPKVDWSQGLQPFAYGDRGWQAWVGVETVGWIADQSLANKRVLQGGA